MTADTAAATSATFLSPNQVHSLDPSIPNMTNATAGTSKTSPVSPTLSSPMSWK